MQTRLSCFSDAESLVDNRDQPFEIKTEADSNDINEHPHDDKSRPYLCTVCYKQFTTKDNLNYHKQMHSAVKRDDMYSCCLLYTSPSPRDRQKSRMPSSA